MWPSRPTPRPWSQPHRLITTPEHFCSRRFSPGGFSMLRLVQLSDLHFAPKHLDDKVRCMEEVCTFLQDWPADLAAIPGDIYDHALRLEDDAAQQSVRLLSALAERCPLLIARGNFTHDRAAVHLLRYVRGRFPIHVSTEPEALWFTGTEVVTVDPAGPCPPRAQRLTQDVDELPLLEQRLAAHGSRRP